MGIYITGMEMPQDREIILRIDEKGEVYVYGTYPTELHKAIPVPPHGRLGDLDALAEKAIRRSEKCGELVNVLDNVITAYDIKTAPTVIPAEKEG